MVSPLTGRLLAGGYTSAGSEGSASKKRKSEPVDVANTSGSSGYAADVDQVGTSVPPFYVDFQARNEDLKSPSGSKDNKTKSADGVRVNGVSPKRQKTLEKNFLAQNAQMELARGGLTMPKLRLSCPRILPPLCGIDMSNVTLMHSSDFASSNPSPIPTSTNHTPKQHKDIPASDIASIFDACRHFYKLPTVQKASEGERSDDQSTTSSVTDTESGNSDDENAVMTMCDALSLCKQPRIVVLSSAPFTVVHVNAAFLHLTGLSSVRLLGQPFQDLILDGKWISALCGTSSSGEPFDLKQMHRQTIKTRTGSQKGSPLQCIVSASPIGTAHDRVTHFALGLDLCDGKTAASSSSQPEQPASSESAIAMTVAG